MNANALKQAAGDANGVQGQGRACLIVDDETTLARNLAVYLERLGWATHVAGSAEEGLAQFAEFRPDVVLLDHNLPGASGLATLPRLQALDPHACVVLMTGFGSIDLAVSAMRQGAADYLTKPLALAEVKLLLERLATQRRLESAVDYYRGRDADSSGLDKILGASPAIVALRGRVQTLLDAERRLTDSDAPTVLIHGETGTGKELVARALHFGGPRATQPFVELSCGALPQQLIEAELFGYEKGAFTDARQRKAGLVESAEGGTLFLDEIGEAELPTQVKLLKLLEDRRYRRLGGLREQQCNVRIVSATHQPLEQMIRDGRFRADLYFRLRIVEIEVPPLRQREGDAILLARHFIGWHAKRYRRAEPKLDDQALLLLARYPWPGNVRELRNAMEQALLLSHGDVIGRRELAFLAPDAAVEHALATMSVSAAGEIGAAHSPVARGAAASATDGDLNLERTERRLIETALERCGDNVTHAARLLGISRDTLRYRLERLGPRRGGGQD